MAIFLTVGSIHLLTDLTTTNVLDFLPIKKEDSSPKENMTDNTHINLSTVLLALYMLNFGLMGLETRSFQF